MNCTGNCNQGRTCTCTDRQIVDHHTEQRKAFISMESKRQAALESLGTKWVLHPENPNKPVKGQYNAFGMRKVSGYSEIYFLLLLVVGGAALGLILDNASCHSRWEGSGVLAVSWGPIQGCKVKLNDGRWIPDSRIREIDVGVKQ